jgi:hypothetical protein
MDWIKRNLVFVIGGAVTLVLMGLAGWYCYSGWSNNSQQKELITTAYEELNQLYAKKPAPGDGKKVNNIALAKEQQKEAQEFIQKLAGFLVPIPGLPPGTNVTGRDYSAALQETITQLQREATNSSVILPPRYKFSFEKQAGLVTFAPGTLDALAIQLGEVKAIAQVLNAAKINSLDAIRRERVPGSPDDLSGPASDYIDFQSTTNDLAIISPYEITFHSFTPELAAVLAGFAQSPHGLIVKAINVEPSLNQLQPDPTALTYVAPAYMSPGVSPAARYMEEGGGLPPGARSPYGNRYGQPAPVQPAYAQPTYAQPAAKSGIQPFLKEKQLKVTLLLHVVKILPPQK